MNTDHTKRMLQRMENPMSTKGHSHEPTEAEEELLDEFRTEIHDAVRRIMEAWPSGYEGCTVHMLAELVLNVACVAIGTGWTLEMGMPAMGKTKSELHDLLDEQIKIVEEWNEEGI
jgi:hypothetical protein